AVGLVCSGSSSPSTAPTMVIPQHRTTKAAPTAITTMAQVGIPDSVLGGGPADCQGRPAPGGGGGVLIAIPSSLLYPQWSRHHPGGVAADRCQPYHSKKRESNDPRLSIIACSGQSRGRDSLRAALGS